MASFYCVWDHPPTLRQIEFLQQIARGDTMKRIAFERDISLQAVKNTVARAKVRLGASSMPHAIALAIHEGYISCDFTRKEDLD